MPDNSFYSFEELTQLGLKSFGNNVLISRFARLYNPQHIEIGSNVRIDDFCILSAGTGDIVLKNYIHIGPYSSLFGGSGIEIGNFSGTSSRCSIYSVTDTAEGSGINSLTVPDEYRSPVKGGKVILRDYSSLATNSTILPKVILAEGVFVGAHSLVIRNLKKPWHVYFGVPAQELSERSQTAKEYGEKLLANLQKEANYL